MCTCSNKVYLNKNSLAVKEVLGQSEARLQVTKTSRKAKKTNLLLLFLYRNDILQDIFTTTIDFCHFPTFISNAR